MSIQYTRPSWDTTRIEQAKILAKRSLCSRDQVGAIIVDLGGKIIGEGHNGPPAGFPRPFLKPPGWVNPDPSKNESPCTNWCPRSQIQNEEEWIWSADLSRSTSTTLEYASDGIFAVSNSGSRRMKLETDEQWERLGYTKVKKPSFALNPMYDDCPSLHAEANALITSDRSLRIGGTIYVTSDICMGCAKLIANSGLTRVYVKTGRYDNHRNPQASYDFLLNCGVDVKIDRPKMRSNDGS